MTSVQAFTALMIFQSVVGAISEFPGVLSAVIEAVESYRRIKAFLVAGTCKNTCRRTGRRTDRGLWRRCKALPWAGTTCPPPPPARRRRGGGSDCEHGFRGRGRGRGRGRAGAGAQALKEGEGA